MESVAMSSQTAKKLPIHLQSSHNRLFIKNGRIVNDDRIYDADIFIENGIISEIGHNLVVPGGVKVIDARASTPNEVNYILPGGIDTHTHLQSFFDNNQTVDDYYQGTRAALAGGTTSIINFAFTTKQAPDLITAFNKEREKATQACCDYAIHVVIAEWIEGKTEKEIATLVQDHGVNSFKIFLCYSLQLTDKQIINVLKTCAKYGAIVMAHCENGPIVELNAEKLIQNGITGPEGHLLSRPECIEAAAVHHVSVLSEQVGCPVLIAHVMSKSAAKVIVDERSRNCSLFGETLAASLGASGSNYYHTCWRHAAGHVMSPPLRVDEDTPNALLGCLASGSLQVIGSDHCVFDSKQKAQGEKDFRKIPNGVNGIEERMTIAWDKGVRGGFIDPCRFVAITSTNAAKLFNLYPRKGRIQVGSDADLVIWGRRPRVIKASEHNSMCDFNVFEGTQVESGPLVVVVGGRVVYDQSGLHVSQGIGRYLHREPFPLLAYGPLKLKSRRLPGRVDRSGAQAAVESRMGDLSISASGPKSVGIPPRPDSSDGEGFHSRASKSGVKNMQDSTFKLSGEQIDDKQNRSNIRVSGQPPGGRSSGLW